MTLAIINLIAAIVAGLEGPGGELLRELTALGIKSANNEPLTPEQLAWFNEQREAAAARLVDVHRNEPAVRAGETDLSQIDYEVSFADFRQGFCEPRGARLVKGVINPDPLPDDYTLLSNSDLANACLDAMGLLTAAPGTMDTVDPPRDLHWLGCHAASELGKLLQDTGHAYCPSSEGVGYIAQIGADVLPTIPLEVLDLNLISAVVDRRSTTQIYLSSPDPITLTYNADAEEPPAWEFVAQDPADSLKWKTLDTIASLGSDVEAAVKKGFPDIDPQYAKKLGDQVFKCIRLKSTFATPHQSPLLRQVMLADGKVDKPHLVIEAAVQEKSTGAWVNRTVRLDAESVDAVENVLTFKQRVGKVDKDERPDFDPYFKKIAPANIKPTFSCEAWDGDAGAKMLGCYGFILTGLTVGPISEASARDQLTGYRPNVAVQCCSDIREIRINGRTADKGNYTDCQAIARKLATAQLSQVSQSRLIRVKGFFPVQISGRVNEIRYDPSGPHTEFIADGWTSASSGGRSGGGAKAKCSAEPANDNLDHPTKSVSRTLSGSTRRTSEKRAANGGTGERQPGSKSDPVSNEPTGFRRIIAKPTSPVDGQANKWNGKTYSGKFDKTSTDDFSPDALGTVSTDDDCIIWSPTQLQLDVPIACDAGPVNDDGKLILVATIGSGTFPVWLTMDGGSAGTRMAAASWTYTVKDIGGNVLASAVPLVRARPVGTMTAAAPNTRGLAVYEPKDDESGVELILLDAYAELPGTGGCA